MAWVNRISMNVLAPALIFTALSSRDFDLAANRLLILGCIGVVLGSGLLAWPFARLLHEDRRTFVPPMMFNNCGNMGLPLAVLAFGQPGLSAMVALFTVSNLLHFTLGVWIIDHHAKFETCCAIRWSSRPSPASRSARAAADARLADARHQDDRRRDDSADADFARRASRRRFWSSWRLGVVGGLVCHQGMRWRRCWHPSSASTARSRLLLLFGCLPPAVLHFMVAERFRQEPGKVASIVLIGNMLAVLFVPIGLTLALH
jgi:predicted permease